MTKVTHLSLDEKGGIAQRRIHLREISGDADTPLDTVGQDLRAARLRRGDDLASVSRALKIRKDHLEALEEDRFEQLPGRAYAIGFVRSYADYLGIDPVQSVERFKQEIAGRGDSGLPAASLPSIEEDRQLPHGWLIIAAVVVLLVGYGIYRLAVSADSLVNQPIAAVPQQLTPKPAEKKVAQKPPAPKPVTQTATAPAATLPPADGANAAQTSGQVNPPTTELAALPPGQEYGSQNRSARVILRIHQPTHILVEGPDGRVFINRTLQPGDTYRVPLIEGVTLTAQSGKAVELDLDGQAMGTASNDTGAIEAFPLDPQSVADHANDPG
ncbi:MAG TPA: helix-turn-helix domain-containing protein [Rhizomicrobium sp.]|nr:helix-turn-helix domain-containing protein [Rhizomicrobium sp.]